MPTLTTLRTPSDFTRDTRDTRPSVSEPVDRVVDAISSKRDELRFAKRGIHKGYILRQYDSAKGKGRAYAGYKKGNMWNSKLFRINMSEDIDSQLEQPQFKDLLAKHPEKAWQVLERATGTTVLGLWLFPVEKDGYLHSKSDFTDTGAYDKGAAVLPFGCALRMGYE